MTDRTLASTMVGQPVAMPVALAPTGLTGMQHADGEILAARAAAKAGVPFTLSTMSICSIEDVAENTDQPFWFQLYVMRDRAFIDRLIDRAKAAGCSALVLTLDLQILGQRHKDIRNGLSTPPKPTLANLINLATKPRWCWDMLHTKRRSFGNIHGHVEGVADMSSLSSWTATQFDPRLSWDDVKRFQDRWGGKLILKGILDPEDAEKAAGTGADALIVSNHGGRQLDGALSSITALPAHRGGGRRPDRGADGRRHPVRPGRDQGAGARRQGRVHRPRLPLRPGRDGRTGRHHGARHHPPRAGHDHGAVRPTRYTRRGRAHPGRDAGAGAQHLPVAGSEDVLGRSRALPCTRKGTVVPFTPVF